MPLVRAPKHAVREGSTCRIDQCKREAQSRGCRRSDTLRQLRLAFGTHRAAAPFSEHEPCAHPPLPLTYIALRYTQAFW